jgi:hypothetical protein
MNTARLVLEPMSINAGVLRLAAKLVHADGTQARLWWEVPELWRDALTTWADPWVVGLLFPMMQRGEPVHIEGRISPSLLANLELFMSIWSRWAPGKYHVIKFSADAETELPLVPEPGLAVASFSCGVDSCFTLYRHAHVLAGRRTRRIEAAVVQHGMDIWLDQKNSTGVYAGLLADAQTMLSSLRTACIPMKTNFQQLRLDWAEAWATQEVSALSLLAGRYDTALIANEMPYEWLGFAWASHPVTNPLLGSRGFTVIDDGGEFSRVDKARAISGWPEAMRHLHVCFGVDVPGQYQNCCLCEKCIRTILAFRIAGCKKPDSFKHDPTDAEIRRVRLTVGTKVKRWEQLAGEAETAKLAQTGWARAVRAVLRKQRWREARNRLQQPFVPLRNFFRRMTRGTELSRSEIARRADTTQPASFS